VSKRTIRSPPRRIQNTVAISTKECLYLHDFESLEEAREVIDEFIETCKRGWLLERYGYQTPAEGSRELTRKAA